MPVQTFEEEETGFSLDELKEWKSQLETVVRDHPILAAGIAVGAGVLIARLVKDALDDDSGSWRRRKKSRRSIFGSEIARALAGSLATMAAAKIQESLMEHVQEEADEPEPEPVRRRPRKQGTQRRPAQTRRRKVEE